MKICRLLPLLLVLLLPLPPAAPAAGENVPLAFGDPFPEIVLPAPADAEWRAYLGLGGEGTFTPSRVATQVLLVELLNVHCPHCQMQTYTYNELFKLIEGSDASRGKIKMLGLAVGNNAAEVATFVGRFPVPFPVVADPGFAAWRAIGGTATPFTLYVRLDRPGNPGVVAGSHMGLNSGYLKIYADLQRLAAEEPAALRRQGEQAQRVRQAIAPLYGETELQTRVRNAFIASGGRIVEFAPVELRSGRRVYTALMQRGAEQVRLFAEVTSRTSVCDICHDVHFIYLFDPSGRVVGFEPLQLTKYGNVNWRPAEVEAMRRRVVGRFLAAPKPFDPQVDAVSSATITSAIIFDSLAQGEALLAELREAGLR